MRLRSRQRGLGWFGMLIIGGLVAFFAIVVIKVGPMYLNEMKIASIVEKVSSNPEQSRADGEVLKGYISNYWHLERPQYAEFKDIKVKRNDRGRFLTYKYEAREKLFYNIFVVVEFSGEKQLQNVSS